MLELVQCTDNGGFTILYKLWYNQLNVYIVVEIVEGTDYGSMNGVTDNA